MPAVPKPSHDRHKPAQGDRTKITDATRKKVMARSDGLCERCGRWAAGYGGEMAHLEQAGQLGRGDIAWNIVLLCGPSTNTGTCHHFADHTSAGREWRMQKRLELVLQYNVQHCSMPLCNEETDVLDVSGQPICKFCLELYPERNAKPKAGRRRKK